MKLNRFFSAGLLGACLASVALPALARPQIASGDRLLNTDPQGCLSRADRFIDSLDVETDSGEIDRTGYFEDGTFRILCYGTGAESMVIVFATHTDSVDVATSFVQLALEELSRN
ncbi:hypothetical protein [Pseudanabaena sp. FACHB-2040]|uniref:hypothetical protein n=1 Tax=Pseudanabaena sp. FACHB-2040 TaxID=2692859 RepID=UPI001682D015|nr:hypothetical protein [Pseudanabaena sp. FACHB-2040]MBD2259192.1 hypothetical protein [Pseudanabaena sp. FACHB-2040]